MKNNFLDSLGFTTKNGLVHNLDEAQNNVERLYIEEVKRLIVPADAVFFRRFYENSDNDLPHFSSPAVCIFNQSDSFFNTDKHKDLHAALWSAGKTEVYIILGETRIDIINAHKPAKQEGDDVTLNDKDLRLAEAAIKDFEGLQYAAHLFGSGTFWEQSEMREKIDSNSNPYVFLLDYLMKVREQLTHDKAIKLQATTIDKLLITGILIKFLEGIQDDNGKHTLKDIYKKHNLTTETFEEGLRNGVGLSILGDLAREFNGKIFDTLTETELSEISEANLHPIADFLSADVDVKNSQGFLWKQYSFNYLPAEVISAIYENFIQAEAERNGEKKKDVVYTPLHLVNLMIDEAMPLDQPELFKTNRFKVLDPSCGSGVFLVAAYKRMLQWWAINHWKENGKIGKIEYPDKIKAKQILEENIFGVDIEDVAALVSIFGLTTAFLDKLTPKEIWNNLKFKDLGEKNIQGGLNFTDWAKKAKDNKERFDLVIGNPPFNPSKKGTITDKDLIDLFGKKVPGNKLALKFFEAALYFGKKVCMIIPSNVFLYNKSNTTHEYRTTIFNNYTVEKIYDFTHLRRDLFHKSADTPILTLLVENTPSKQQAIEHVVVKRQLMSEKKMHFEIDFYDKHQVRWDWAMDENKQFVWKTNLLGGGRLFHLIYRLSLLETLEDSIDEHKKENSEWLYSSGYKIGGGSTVKIPASYIHSKQTLCTNPSFDEESESFFTKIETADEFEAPRPEKLYTPPLLVFSEVLSAKKIPMQIFNNKQVFNISFVGIHAPEDKAEVLNEMYERFYKRDDLANTYQVYLLSTSSKLLINKETAFIKEDIDKLPYPQNDKYLKPSKDESLIIDDILKYYRHSGKAITKNSAGAILHELITQEELEAFGNTYCEVLNEIYAEDGKSWQAGQVLRTPTFVRYQFGFGKDGGLKNVFKETDEKEFHALLDNINTNKRVHYKRIIRHYRHENGYDCVFLIKPLAKRYWLQSIALRDADDTFMDLKKAGF